MAARSTEESPVQWSPVIVFGVLAFALALRVMHFSSALQSPLSYQPGPDEDYYRRFGEAVALGHGADTPEFTFMDPGYGYLLGAIFKVIGVNSFAVYLLQALIDTATAYGIVVIGRRLGRPRAGVYGAVLYAATATAIMFCASLLKETCVAGYLTWWIAAALALRRSERKFAWFSFGVYCGIGVALRSTLAMLGLLALFLPCLESRKLEDWIPKAGLIIAGMALSLAPWSIRNHRLDGGFSPLPHNGGIVLHQVYNAQNPASTIWIPPFVSYSHPSEIWRGYASEADARAQRSLSPTEIDRYWRAQALEFMGQHPGEVLADVARKSVVFLAASEIPNNRSSAEERMFSPVLEVLPPPAAWLLAMGLAGLVWLALQDRRWIIVAAPIFISWFTVAVFWAEDRFRFHALPALALLAGIWIEEMARRVEGRSRWLMPAFGLLAALIGATSLFLGREFPPPAVRWDHIVWGYIKMGKLEEARRVAARVAREQPDNEPNWEAQGYLEAAGQHYSEAVRDYQRAIALRPRSYMAHYNLAKTFLALGDRPSAAGEAELAMGLNPTDDTQALLNQAQAAP